MFLRKSLFSCYVPLLPRNLAKDRKEGVPLPDVDELILYYPNKSSTYYSTLDAFIVPRLFIMHFITWMFYFIKKKKKPQWGKYPRCVWDLCHDTKYTACIHNSWWKVTHQPPLHDRQFPYAMRNQTHWIFVGPVLPLCVIAHWDYPLKRGIFKPTLLLFQLILSSFNSYFSPFAAMKFQYKTYSFIKWNN